MGLPWYERDRIARATHAAAREAARAAGHAVATAHVDGHATGTANYGIKAAIASTPNDTDVAENEREWQFERLPTHLRSVVTTG